MINAWKPIVIGVAISAASILGAGSALASTETSGLIDTCLGTTASVTTTYSPSTGFTYVQSGCPTTSSVGASEASVVVPPLISIR